MDELIAPIIAELQRRGLSEAAASRAAVGNPSALKNLRVRRGAGTRNHPVENLKAIADSLGLEFYIGPPREQGVVKHTMVEGSDFAQVPLHEAFLAAGQGVENQCETVVGHLAFRRDWMRKIGTSPSNAVLARAQGDSMQPSIWHDDVVMIDRARSEIPIHNWDPNARQRLPIYALLDDGLARLKRVERPEANRVLLLSDNPDYPPQLAKIETLHVIGKVVWWGHTEQE